MQVIVHDNNVDQALKALKKKMQREGVFHEMKLRGHYEKPSEKKARENQSLRAENAEQSLQLSESKNERNVLLGSLVMLLLLTGLGFVIYRTRQERRAQASKQ